MTDTVSNCHREAAPQERGGDRVAYANPLRTLRDCFVAAFLAMTVVAGGAVAPAHPERIKERASIGGVRSNALIGYGLVVGLDGTGDQTTQTPFTTQSLTTMLSQLGVT